MTNSVAHLEQKKVLPKSEEFFLIINQLNAQLGVFDALIVDQCRKFRKEEHYFEFKEQILTANSEKETASGDSDKDKGPKRSEILEWVANRLTRVMYGLYDMGLVFGRNTLAHSDSRIDSEEVKWLVSLRNALAIPDAEGPVLPIGNELAAQCYVAVNLCQHSIFKLREFALEDERVAVYLEYLSNLEKLLICFARLSNLVSNNKEWFWKSASETTKS